MIYCRKVLYIVNQSKHRKTRSKTILAHSNRNYKLSHSNVTRPCVHDLSHCTLGINQPLLTKSAFEYFISKGPMGNEADAKKMSREISQEDQKKSSHSCVRSKHSPSISPQGNFANESLELIHRLLNPHVLPHNEGNTVSRNVGLWTATRAMVVACDVFDFRAVGLL